MSKHTCKVAKYDKTVCGILSMCMACPNGGQLCAAGDVELIVLCWDREGVSISMYDMCSLPRTKHVQHGIPAFVTPRVWKLLIRGFRGERSPRSLA